ncbi:MAG: hypothetical protein OEL20_04465 [Sulfuritalea sp.]|nr:hypothetical protein [Sulfuritalea sp.]
MNVLRLFTQERLDGTYDVFWMTGARTKGVVQVSMPDMADARVAAELSVARKLLVEHNACGHNKTGAGLCIYVSAGATRKLMRQGSDKVHLVPYALFLRTRFVGAQVVVDKDRSWIDPLCEEDRERLAIHEPQPEHIELGGYGEVELTAHVLERFGKHFGGKVERSWLNLAAAAKDAVPGDASKRRAISNLKHRKIGSFAINHRKNIVFVVVPADHPERRPKLATAYPGPPP